MLFLCHLMKIWKLNPQDIIISNNLQRNVFSNFLKHGKQLDIQLIHHQWILKGGIFKSLTVFFFAVSYCISPSLC